MQPFFLSGAALFDADPQPVFFIRQQLIYWNPAAQRLCQRAGVPLEEGGPVPAFLAHFPLEAECAGDLTLDGRPFAALLRPLEEGSLCVLHPAAQDRVLSGRRLAFLMDQARRPMSTLYSALQLLSPLVGQEGDKYLEMLSHSYFRMLRLMEHLSFVQRLEDDQEPFRPVVLDLAGLCRHILREVEPLARQSGLAVAYEEAEASLLVSGEEPLLQLLLLNLISNAWRASGTAGTITLSLRRRGNRALLTVSDQGGGMAPSALASAFAPEPGTEALSDPWAGQGLGLPLCRHIAVLHQGALVLENRPGQGVTASLSLPLAKGGSLPLRSPALPLDATGGLSPVLIELADVLPYQAYSKQDLE